MKFYRGYTALLSLLLSHCVLAQVTAAAMEMPKESVQSIKYAIFSSAWNTSSNAGLRVVAQNQSDHPIRLQSVLFRSESEPLEDKRLTLELEVPAGGWAERELPYSDLLFGSDCIAKTMEEDWKLVEISNYTLNPSVRGLIIEDTESFRIYQCVRNVQVRWLDTITGAPIEYTEWLMYHFERRPPI